MAREIEASSVVVVARTADRSVLGQIVDFAKMIPFHLPDSGWSEGDLKAVEDRLAETPCRGRPV
jgi:hypothetical protein